MKKNKKKEEKKQEEEEDEDDDDDNDTDGNDGVTWGDRKENGNIRSVRICTEVHSVVNNMLDLKTYKGLSSNVYQ